MSDATEGVRRGHGAGRMKALAAYFPQTGQGLAPSAA
jgi:hypothetical protein